ARRHAALKHQRLGSAADAAVLRAHDDGVAGRRIDRFGADFAAAGRGDPEGTGVEIHRSHSCAFGLRDTIPGFVSAAFTLSYGLKSTIVFCAIAATALSGLRAHHPFPRVGPANVVTTIRALFVSLVAGLIGEEPSAWLASAAVAAGSVATVLDGVDGWLARWTGMASAFGARYDMEVDALLIMVLAVLVWEHGKAGI